MYGALVNREVILAISVLAISAKTIVRHVHPREKGQVYVLLHLDEGHPRQVIIGHLHKLLTDF